MQEPFFVGGIPEQITGAKFTDVELEIDTYSMERANEVLLQRRAMECYNMVMQSAQLMVNTPYVDWSAMLSKLGDAMNIPELGEMINQEQLMQMIQAQQQQQQQEQAVAQMQAQASAAQSNAQAQQMQGGQ